MNNHEMRLAMRLHYITLKMHVNNRETKLRNSRPNISTQYGTSCVEECIVDNMHVKKSKSFGIHMK